MKKLVNLGLVATLALAFGSGVSLLLVISRMIYTGNLGYAFLIWNLFLAWLPFIFAIFAQDEFRKSSRSNSGSRWRLRSSARIRP